MNYLGVMYDVLGVFCVCVLLFCVWFVCDRLCDVVWCVYVCLMCGFACVVCCCRLSLLGGPNTIYCVMLHGLLLCGCCRDCVFPLHMLVRFVLLFVCAVLWFVCLRCVLLWLNVFLFV